jgi:hypothetical protein
MAKQTFTTGQVLTAAQMTSLQQTAMLGGAASAKVASYTLVAADAGTAISMSNASATTITVNTGLFAAGDTVQITNLGAGVCTITAGTATVNTSASLALAQYESGTLNFTSTSAAIFIKGAGAAASGGGETLISTTTLSAATSISLTSIPTTYKHLRVLFIDCFNNTHDTFWTATFNNDATAKYSYVSSSIKSNSMTCVGLGADSNSSIGASKYFAPIAATNTAANNGGQNGHFDIYNYASTTLKRSFEYTFAGYSSADNCYFNGHAQGNYHTTGTAITRVDFTRSASQSITGTLQLWGIS